MWLKLFSPFGWGPKGPPKFYKTDFRRVLDFLSISRLISWACSVVVGHNIHTTRGGKQVLFFLLQLYSPSLCSLHVSRLFFCITPFGQAHDASMHAVWMEEDLEGATLVVHAIILATAQFLAEEGVKLHDTQGHREAIHNS